MVSSFNESELAFHSIYFKHKLALNSCFKLERVGSKVMSSVERDRECSREKILPHVLLRAVCDNDI